jgi:hypothetical protein
MIRHTIPQPPMRLFALSLLSVTVLAACSVETRHRWWQTLDPAGYKHTHSKVFNPQRYRDEPSEKMTEREMAEFDLSQ